MAGDDYGRPASVPWAVTFTDPDAARIGGVSLGVPLHPVQLYESAVCLALFGVLMWLARRRHRDGDIIAAYTLLYAIARFVLEFFVETPIAASSSAACCRRRSSSRSGCSCSGRSHCSFRRPGAKNLRLAGLTGRGCRRRRRMPALKARDDDAARHDEGSADDG
jgi:hypothetical protein